MAEAKIEVNKQSIKEFLETGKSCPFVIPEYQREYAWEEEQVNQLFDDIWEFTQNHVIGIDEPSENYFLGCVVAYRNANRESEIIDGQQRLTTLFLLLRAIYAKLENCTRNKDVENSLRKISPLLWKTDRISGEEDRNKILISSRVISEEANEIFKKILRNGIISKNAQDKYSENYELLQRRINELAQIEAMNFYNFISALLDYVIIMPIVSEDQETAMTIFLTLNDRGMQLTDADIFKAKIFSQLPFEERPDFVESWKQLSEETKWVDLDVQDLFTYHSFYCRAKEGDKDTTRMGIRKYYSENQFSRLKSPSLMNELWKILDFWKVVRLHEHLNNESWSYNKYIVQAIDVLSNYGNDCWKYVSISYYLIHHEDRNFENNFLYFLRKTSVMFLETYLISPGANAIKSKMFNLNVEIGKSENPRFDFRKLSSEELKSLLISPNNKIVRMILTLLAYIDHPNELLPRKWDVEHILPKKYDNTYFFPCTHEVIDEMIEHIGNKLPLERKNNIQASNGYFSKKKEIYLRSNISCVKDFLNEKHYEWKLNDINERDKSLIKKLIDILQKWNYGELSTSTDALLNTEQSTNEKCHDNGISTRFSQNDERFVYDRRSEYANFQNDVKYDTRQRKFTPKSSRTSFWVRFPNGEIIRGSTAAEAFTKTISAIGPEKVSALNLRVYGDNLVSKERSHRWPDRDHRIKDGYFVRTGTSTMVKINELQEISDRLNLNLKITLLE